MKKLFVLLFAFLLTTFGFVAITVNAGGLEPEGVDAGTQQTAVPISVTLTTYFDTSNTVTSEVGDRWFDESIDTLYTLSAGAWDAGVILPVSQPGSPSEGDRWFDEGANKLYTYTTTWDAGVALATTQPNMLYGAKLAFDGSLASHSGYTFFCWIVNGIVRTDLALTNQFTLTNDMDLVAVFHPNDPLKYAVVFMDSNGEMLKVEYVSSGGAATAPVSLPTKLGYSTNGWSVQYSNVVQDTITVLQYTKTNTTQYALSVQNGTGSGDYEFNTVASVTATDRSGENLVFNYWQVGDKIVSYSSTYSFTMVQATSIWGVYGAAAVTAAPTLTMSPDLALRGGYKTFICQFYLPTGYTLVEYGMIGKGSSGTFIDLGTSGITRYQAGKYNATTKEYVLSIETANATAVRAYMICEKTLDHSLITVYNESAYQVLNGGFETDTLYGWNVWRLWKDEAPMAAWDVSLVTNSTYFDGSFPYGRDGSYNMGITSSGGTNWDQNSERMGYLRSSDFILGGSGWISFKLGGGQCTSFAYMSIRKTSDNTEVARFGNPNYKNTTIATAQYGPTITNAEAFLFQYYFNLSSVATLGDSYYVLFCDTSAYSWSILSIDSVITYYPAAPTPGSNQTAVNILPSIYLAGSATTALSNGLTANVDNWGDPNAVFRWDGGAGRTNKVSGDADLGVARSSAFKIDSSIKYLRWQWEGNISQDKRIYLSIREVGTNIEVLRLIRRYDQRNKTGGGFDFHWYDLSTVLSTSKEYYIELSDNMDGDYGLISVKEISISSTIGAVGSDVAESISGLPTNYSYNRP